MFHRLMGRLHAAAISVNGQRGQGTVEYVALILLVAAVLAGVVAAAHGFSGGKEIPKLIADKLKDAVDSVVPGGK